jgi:ElaB/YqjD/DUF883 family membrane-anchored ribosome-binding protein
MAITHDDVERLDEILNEMNELLDEAKRIVRKSSSSQTKDRARAYWIGHIDAALDDEGEYVSHRSQTMAGTIDDLRDEVAGVSEEESDE